HARHRRLGNRRCCDQRRMQPDPPPATPAPATTTTDRRTKMPLRQQTRQQSRAQRINTERRLNTEQDKPPPF
ncbi:hypothetical protein, partial [Mycolicibacterium fortuitum]|uniref:hypothetical protein n=1 Tax=Mycolicibacterium fortuitum TaxID=1766 RepID=UPI003999FD16